MPAVKVLPKGQITLPKKTRDRLGIKVGDTLILEEQGKGITLARGKTLLDYKGALPDLGMTIGEMREKGIAEAVKRNG